MTVEDVKGLIKKENPLILEIGAHHGGDTIKFLNEFKDIRIYCFEPDPRCISEFKKNIQDKRCKFLETAVSSSDGKAVLNMSAGSSIEVPRLLRFLGLKRCYELSVLKFRRLLGRQSERSEWDWSSSIKKSISHPKDWSWIVFNKTIEVNTLKLDTFVKDQNIRFIDFIWSDVQGAERDMIEGGVDSLKIVKYLYVEYGEVSTYPDAMTRKETIDLLNKYNFEVISQYSDNAKIGNLLFVNRGLNNC